MSTWRNPKRLNVDLDQITPSDFRCGDILGGSNGEQYTVVDTFGPSDNEDEKERGFLVPPYATLEKLEAEERIKPELITGRVEL